MPSPIKYAAAFFGSIIVFAVSIFALQALLVMASMATGFSVENGAVALAVIILLSILFSVSSFLATLRRLAKRDGHGGEETKETKKETKGIRT